MNKILFAALIALFTACNSTSEQTEKEKAAVETKVSAAKTYACPMLCEGDKTYSKPGRCPVCNMDLQEVALTVTDSTANTH